MNWNDITVGQYQDIYRLSLTEGLDEMDRNVRLICILYNKTEDEVDDLSMADFNRLFAALKFITNDKIPGSPVRDFVINGKKYVVNYRVNKLKYWQRNQILDSITEPVLNMHIILASILKTNKSWGKGLNPIEARAHVAAEMLKAPLPVIYHACIFFCKVFKETMVSARTTITKDMVANGGLTVVEANDLLNNSIAGVAGIIADQEEISR